MDDLLKDSYESIPYPAEPHPQSHPARLAAIATLFGVQPPPVPSCRLLEVGCANGRNLLPMAVAYPNSQFVGIDLSNEAIASARRTSDQLALNNITWIEGDLARDTDGHGPFDFILAHGVYSWVPDHIADRLLALMHQNLTSNGIAYISYNTLPGWQPRALLRALALRRAQGTFNNQQSVRAAIECFESVAGAFENAAGGFPRLTLDSIRAMLPHGENYIAHDILEIFQRPVAFLEFDDHLSRHQLRYLADAEYHANFGRGIPSATRDRLVAIAADRAELELLMDIAVYRSFRQSIVVKKETIPSPSFESDQLSAFEVAGKIDRWIDESTYATSRGLQLRQDDDLGRRIVDLLIETGSIPTPIETFVQTLSAQSSSSVDAREVFRRLVQMFSYDAIDMTIGGPSIAKQPSETPFADPLARLQAIHSDHVDNRLHLTVDLTPEERQLLPLLDGTATVDSLATRLGFSPSQISHGLESIAKKALLPEHP